MEVSENFLRPEINSTFAGITMRQLDHRDPLRPEEQQQRNDPQPDGNSAVGGNRRNDVQIEDRYYEEQHQIAAPESAIPCSGSRRRIDCVVVDTDLVAGVSGYSPGSPFGIT